MQLSITQIAQITETEIFGPANTPITRLCSLEDAQEGGICYLTSLDKPELLKNLIFQINK